MNDDKEFFMQELKCEAGQINPDLLFNRLLYLSESGALTEELKKLNSVLYASKNNGEIIKTASSTYTAQLSKPSE